NACIAFAATVHRCDRRVHKRPRTAFYRCALGRPLEKGRQSRLRMATKHSHSHLGREHSDHDHGDGARSSHQALVWALVVTGGMALVEGIGAFWSGSLALLSDAGHMATDAAALGLALFASRIARRPPSRRASYGYARAEVLAAFVNALALLSLVVFISVEAVRRLLEPAPVAGGAVLTIAIVGLLANLVSAWILSRASSS